MSRAEYDRMGPPLIVSQKDGDFYRNRRLTSAKIRFIIGLTEEQTHLEGDGNK
jgi:hypothetical protein